MNYGGEYRSPATFDAHEQGYRTAATKPPEPEYAAFAIRLGARLLDQLYIMLAVAVFAFVAGMIAYLVSGPPVRSHHLMRTIVLSTVMGILAEAIAEGFGGATLGKMSLGLRVVRPDGERIGVGAALGRSAAFLIDMFFFGLVAYSSMSSSPIYQRYGDKWADTAVVYKRSLRDVPSAFVPALLGLLFYGIVMAVDAVVP